MVDDNSRNTPGNSGATTPDGGLPDQPVVTESPSSRQPRNEPPAGSEPQGRITTIAAIVAIVVVAVLVVLLFL